MTRHTISLKTIAAIVIGNALEWYDFIVYSFMTVFIAHLFFPSDNPTNSLLAATATFGVAFFMRPIGGVILGVYADKKGRKAAMTLVISLMTLALFIISITPTYTTIGIAAPCILLLARLLQGFSAAGEFGSSTALLIELSPSHRIGLYGSWQMFGQIFAILIGGCVGMLLTHYLSQEQLTAWGWRLPFIAGLIIAPIGIYIRRHLHEVTPTVKTALTTTVPTSTNTKELFIAFSGRIFAALGIAVAGTASFYVNLIFMPTFATRYLHLSMNSAFIAISFGALMCVLLIPWLGTLSDYVGRRKMILISLSVYIICLLPTFSLLVRYPTATNLILFEILNCTILSGYLAAFTTLLAELFPQGIRASGLSISNNFAIMLFGGFGQFIVTWLLKVTGTLMAPSYYICFAAAISLISTYFVPQQKFLQHEYSTMAR